ncbi:Uncharacterized protein PCOAH_00050900 [Plasmodium coatneyi]|uniref:Uncharacterized protein n=1 Tax=Plasmodium coatneyi TaxID=208452 RepID=A0A1B1E6J7_9APIC|nr:Uncharacterized protein PCOAH_00050900 [Plasmodium coatneyi]ANQ10570.1 Uncharacterized protein PCOAH_00050900 [Plasmodium coatneyi]
MEGLWSTLHYKLNDHGGNALLARVKCQDVPFCDGRTRKENHYAVSNKSKQKDCTVTTSKELYHCLEFKKNEKVTYNMTVNSVNKKNFAKKESLPFAATDNEPPPGRENNNVPNALMKRILKDTFDMKHSINSIKSILCPILIFHSENYSYKNSSSYILLDNAKECHKKAAFLFDFMNEDFVTAFKKENFGTSTAADKQPNSSINREQRQNTRSNLEEICSCRFYSTFGEIDDNNLNVPLINSVTNTLHYQGVQLKLSPKIQGRFYLISNSQL